MLHSITKKAAGQKLPMGRGILYGLSPTPIPAFALRGLSLGVVNHMHLRDIRSKDLDLGPSSAQVDQDPMWRKSIMVKLPNVSCRLILQVNFHQVQGVCVGFLI